MRLYVFAAENCHPTPHAAKKRWKSRNKGGQTVASGAAGDQDSYKTFGLPSGLISFG